MQLAGTKIKLYLWLLTAGFLMSCAQLAPGIQLKAWSSLSFIEHENWVGKPVDFTPADSLRKQIEQRQGLILKNRGEAHITLITPPEFNVLKKHLSMDALNKLVQKENIQQIDFRAQCLGRGQKDSLQTFFVVVDSPGLLNLRHKIAALYQSHGGKKDEFDADNFYPHITLGFTERDLHDTDGVIKNKSSCYESL